MLSDEEMRVLTAAAVVAHRHSEESLPADRLSFQLHDVVADAGGDVAAFIDAAAALDESGAALL